MNDPTSTVAIVRSTSRRGAVAEALALVRAAGPIGLTPDSSVLADFAAARSPWAWTQADALAATLDVMLVSGAERVVVPVPDRDRLDRSRFAAEAIGRPVRFALDSDRICVNDWAELDLDLGDPDGLVRVRVRPEAERDHSIVALASMKTSGASSLALGLAGLVAMVHPADRATLGLGSPPSARSRLVDGWIKARGRFRRRVIGSGPEAARRDRAARIIVALARQIRPTVSIVDGSVALHREGPDHGEPIRLGVVVAGTDPVAVDAVAARVMGFDPRAIAHLRRAADLGLGVIDAGAIRLVGDPIESTGECCVPHSSDRGGPAGPASRGPHFARRAARARARSTVQGIR